MKTIFTITTLRAKHKRCVGWFPTKKQAIDTVTDLETGENISEEGYYPLAVVEELRPGIYPCPPISEEWFKWCSYWTGQHTEPQKWGYFSTHKPNQYKNAVNFGIG